MSPTQALAYLFWTQHRRGLILLGGYWLAVMIFCLIVPAGCLKFEPGGGGWSAWMAIALLYSSWISTVFLILDFTFIREVRLTACESSFPARLRTLPLPTPALTGGLMLWGSATMILGWMTLAWAARRPFDGDVPLLWPGLMFAGLLAWLQAIFWTPFPLSWLRGFLLIPVTIVFGSTTIAALGFDLPSLPLCGLFTVLLLAAYGTALRGVARARRGDNVQWGRPTWLRWPWAVRMRPPFRSAAGAQLWFEWRLHGLIFPTVVTIIPAIMLPILLSVKNLGQLDREELSFVQTFFTGAIVMLWIPGTVWLSGMAMGRLGTRIWCQSSFLATRPVSTAMLLRAKFVAATWNTLAGWGVLAIGSLLWLTLSGQTPEAVQQFEAMRQQHEPGLFWGGLILLVVGSIVLIWLQMVQWIWIGLLGSRLALLLFFCGYFAYIMLICFIFLLTGHPEYWFEYWPLFNRLLPWLAGAAVLLKTLAAAWSLHALRRRRLIPSIVLWGTLAIWLALAAGTFAALCALLPDNYFSLPGVVLGIVLLLPLTRLALAPLALSWNRHR